VALGSCRFYVLLENANNTLYGPVVGEKSLQKVKFILPLRSSFDSTILPIGKL
jgi:hypothetical protein